MKKFLAVLLVACLWVGSVLADVWSDTSLDYVIAGAASGTCANAVNQACSDQEWAATYYDTVYAREQTAINSGLLTAGQMWELIGSMESASDNISQGNGYMTAALNFQSAGDADVAAGQGYYTTALGQQQNNPQLAATNCARADSWFQDAINNQYIPGAQRANNADGAFMSAISTLCDTDAFLAQLGF